ncbi:putative 1-phosphatidylinositol 3-phosphate 5-kinase [Eupeodes corollae]|uniref:putative 1-phosphatidylinositol 3-phosphate 5-kinase n=1 Tax=Eupeodes corollae TaxID=290404 RepID=UPI0024933847|nr:putative 1-phosphatidylinositol 3-phosphate 5-kinase [Eupeodes corollae]
MNQHLHSPHKLTEFARDFEEEPETFLSKFVNKIQNAYNSSYNTVNDAPTGSTSSGPSTPIAPKPNSQSTFYAEVESISRNSSSSSLSSANKIGNSQTNQDGSGSTTTTEETTSESTEKTDEIHPEASEGRTMLNVLKRISNIVAAKNSNLRNYKDTELQRFWMPDAKAKECYDCSQKFSAFRRKHHCRLCGQIFCSKCCNQVVPGTIIMCSGDLKVCNYCSKIVLSYLKSPNITDDLKLDLQALQEDLSSKLSQNNESDENLQPRSSLPRKVSVGYQEERFAANQINILSNADRRNILQQSNSLIILHEEMIRQLPSQNCGLELIEFLNTNQKSSNKIQAVAILSAMHAAGFLLPIVPDSDQTEFDENLHYRFAPKRPDVMTTGILEVDVDPDTPIPNPNEYSPKYDSELQPPKSIDMSLSFQSVKDVELENSIRSTTTTSKLLESYCDHEDQLLTQMLRNANLDQTWSKVLTPLCCRAANHFKPEYCTNELMDIRNYVNFKKVPGGKRQECTIVGGVVFTKNVAHKDMATRVDRPKILLLQCPIVYERVEGKFVSISTVLLQEKEYLGNVTARIMNFKPNVVLVHKNVAGIAQDMLRSHGITLVLDVKISVMERLSKALQCDIVSSIESNIGKPKLGMCDAFYIKSFDDGFGTTKTLMYFEKLSSPRGYTCLLRGGNNAELAKVKQVASFLVYARYNWRLEMSFLLDEFARPLSPKPLIFDSKEQSPSDDLESGELLRADNNNIVAEHDNDVIGKPVQFSMKKLIERKSEDKLVTIENVNDFTDPLRSTDLENNKLSPDSSIVELAVETPYDNRFRTALNSTILSVSPFLTFPLPYLETEHGRKCPLRSHFPKELFYSKQLSSTSSNDKPSQNENEAQKPTNHVGSGQVNPLHPFLTTKITTPIDNRELQTLLAEFRSFGGKYPKKKKMTKIKHRESFQKPQKVSEEQLYKDALDLENHQRLPVLFCSFYFNPQASSFCAQPTLLDMKFYGQQDIMLGQFLQRYCFRVSYICQLCNLPMMDHVRRYVHSTGCVQVFLNKDTIKNDPNRIYFTSWCSICNEVSPSVPISDTTKCLSFAKYLELRFYGHAYKKRSLDNSDSDSELLQTKCNHSLNRDYIHYFTYNGIGAKFMYSPIEIWEIGLPPLVLHLKKPKPFHDFQVKEDIKAFSQAGHEVYSKIHEKIADFATEDETNNLATFKTSLHKDQFDFKKHVEVVHTLLVEKEANSYDINDGMIMAKRALAESIEAWTPKLHEMGVKAKSQFKHDSNQQIDSGQICTEDLRSDMESPTGEAKVIPEGQEEADAVTPLEKNKNLEHVTDKKSIKKMLSSFLPSTATANLLQSPLSANEHLTLPLGTIPILVHDQDLSSIIAYSLTSHDYNKLVDMISHSSGHPPTSSPNPKKKSDGAFEFDEKEAPKTSEDEKKPSKSNSHIDMAFQDSTTQFTCKVFFAKEFDLLRANTLKVPKMGRNLFKELEHSKNREELKITQKGSNSEIEIIRKASDPAIQTPISKPPEDESSQLQSDIEATRVFLARSLCRSVQWEARGGKSGSKFSKTLDDRFVLKEMTPKDIAIFENFAPNYFEYISKCHQQNHPTLLAKIVGVFRVTIKKKDSFQEKFMLVMENLFYECDIKNKFDLKGSERNRLVNPTNQNGEIVLLDENLVQMSWSKPLYVLSHSKAVLKDAINRDSSFLAKNQVMDYSLLVGLNNKGSMLVLGIIDYIRTYTFDKRVETLLKTLGSGMGKQPTIIPPECYMKRFTDAMDRYFYTVPDRWEGLSKA